MRHQTKQILPLDLKQTHGLLSTLTSGPARLGVVSKLRIVAAHKDGRYDAPHNNVWQSFLWCSSGTASWVPQKSTEHGYQSNQTGIRRMNQSLETNYGDKIPEQVAVWAPLNETWLTNPPHLPLRPARHGYTCCSHTFQLERVYHVTYLVPPLPKIRMCMALCTVALRGSTKASGNAGCVY